MSMFQPESMAQFMRQGMAGIVAELRKAKIIFSAGI